MTQPLAVYLLAAPLAPRKETCHLSGLHVKVVMSYWYGTRGCIIARVDGEVRSRNVLSECQHRDDARVAGSLTLLESVTSTLQAGLE
jgi:hypothetical protein